MVTRFFPKAMRFQNSGKRVGFRILGLKGMPELEKRLNYDLRVGILKRQSRASYFEVCNLVIFFQNDGSYCHILKWKLVYFELNYLHLCLSLNLVVFITALFLPPPHKFLNQVDWPVCCRLGFTIKQDSKSKKP